MRNYSTLNKGCIYDYDTSLKNNVAWLDTAIFYNDDGTLHTHIEVVIIALLLKNYVIKRSKKCNVFKCTT